MSALSRSLAASGDGQNPSLVVVTRTILDLEAAMAHPLISSQSPAPRSEPIASFRDDYRFLSNFWFVPGGVTASATDETGGTGQNWLGRLLMVQRSFLLARDQGTGATLL